MIIQKALLIIYAYRLIIWLLLFKNCYNGIVVGNFSATDPDSGNILTYSIAGNSNFEIINGNGNGSFLNLMVNPPLLKKITIAQALNPLRNSLNHTFS